VAVEYNIRETIIFDNHHKRRLLMAVKSKGSAR